jgi:ribonuclease R
MKDKIGEEFDGIITGIIEAGLFVMLESTAEGFVAFRTMRDHYLFDERRYRAIGARSGNQLYIGQRVRVMLSSVDEDRRHIDFVMAQEEQTRDKGDHKTPGRRKQKTVARIRKKGRRRH